MNLVDPDGRLVGTALDIISVASGVKNLIQNIKAGNVKDAILDGVGIVGDVAAAAVPIVPGGVGKLRADVEVSATRGETSHTKLGRKMHQEYNPGDVRELKPNNPRAIKRGEQQVQAYKKELENKYPDISWEWHIDVYDK